MRSTIVTAGALALAACIAVVCVRASDAPVGEKQPADSTKLCLTASKSLKRESSGLRGGS